MLLLATLPFFRINFGYKRGTLDFIGSSILPPWRLFDLLLGGVDFLICRKCRHFLKGVFIITWGSNSLSYIRLLSTFLFRFNKKKYAKKITSEYLEVRRKNFFSNGEARFWWELNIIAFCVSRGFLTISWQLSCLCFVAIRSIECGKDELMAIPNKSLKTFKLTVKLDLTYYF